MFTATIEDTKVNVVGSNLVSSLDSHMRPAIVQDGPSRKTLESRDQSIGSSSSVKDKWQLHIGAGELYNFASFSDKQSFTQRLPMGFGYCNEHESL